MKRDECQLWIDTPPEKKVYWDLSCWKKAYYEEHGAHPSPEEITQKQKALIAALPTNKEKQVEIFGEIIYPVSESLFD